MGAVSARLSEGLVARGGGGGRGVRGWRGCVVLTGREDSLGPLLYLLRGHAFTWQHAYSTGARARELTAQQAARHGRRIAAWKKKRAAAMYSVHHARGGKRRELWRAQHSTEQGWAAGWRVGTHRPLTVTTAANQHDVHTTPRHHAKYARNGACDTHAHTRRARAHTGRAIAADQTLQPPR